jgi:8-oxo-dGTP pyrophosphatase MutT (NUDIX family)
MGRQQGAAMPKVEVISRRRVFDDFFKIDEAKLRFERYDGSMSEVVRRLNFERGDSAAALLFDARSHVVYLIEQFMYPTLAKAGGWLQTVVAGMIDEGETPEEAILREIVEEAGLRPSVSSRSAISSSRRVDQASGFFCSARWCRTVRASAMAAVLRPSMRTSGSCPSRSMISWGGLRLVTTWTRRRSWPAIGSRTISRD